MRNRSAGAEAADQHPSRLHVCRRDRLQPAAAGRADTTIKPVARTILSMSLL